jgi:hypothetical protein
MNKEKEITYLSYHLRFVTNVVSTRHELLEYYECLLELAKEDLDTYKEDVLAAIQWYRDDFYKLHNEKNDLYLCVCLYRRNELDNGDINIQILRRHMRVLAAFIDLYKVFEDYKSLTPEQVEEVLGAYE